LKKPRILRRSVRLSAKRELLSKINNQYIEIPPEKVFGYNKDVSLIIMQFIGHSRTLLSLSTVNKLLRSLITEEMVIKAALYTGGRPLESITNTYRFMKSKSGFIASPLRLLRMINGRRCEFCNNVEVDIRYAYPGEDLSNAKPRRVRPQWNVFACYACCKTKRNPQISETWDHDCLTKTFDRLVLSMQRCYHENVYYTSNRALLYNIFCHPRITSYPIGIRQCRMVNGFLENVFDSRDDSITKHDRMELMWACVRYDDKGDRVGPIFNRTLVSELVSYLKTEHSQGIDYFINNMIPGVPNVSDYETFVSVYEQHIPHALQLNEQRRMKRTRELLHRRYVWIDNTVHAIAVIVSHINFLVLRRQFPPCQTATERLKDIKMVRKVMLCYHEAYPISLRRPVTYRTGDGTVNEIINDTLKQLYKNPLHVIASRSKAKQIARTLFIKIKSCINWQHGISTKITDSRGNIVSSFSINDPYPSHRIRRKRGVPQPWRDTSSNRNP